MVLFQQYLEKRPVGVGGLFLKWRPHSAGWVGPLILSSATIRDVWIIPSSWIWCYVLYVEHVSCVSVNCGQHQWVIPSSFSIDVKALLEEPLPENYYPYVQTHSSKLCSFRLLSWCPVLFYYFSLLYSGWFVIRVYGSISVRELVKC